MRRPPRAAESRILPMAMASWSLVQGSLALGVVAAVLWSSIGRGMPESELRALVFVSLVLVNASLILVNRSFSGSLLSALLRRNISLWILLSSVAVLLAVVLTWRPAMDLFRFGPLHADDLGVSLLAGFRERWNAGFSLAWRTTAPPLLDRDLHPRAWFFATAYF